MHYPRCFISWKPCPGPNVVWSRECSLPLLPALDHDPTSSFFYSSRVTQSIERQWRQRTDSDRLGQRQTWSYLAKFIEEHCRLSPPRFNWKFHAWKKLWFQSRLRLKDDFIPCFPGYFGIIGGWIDGISVKEECNLFAITRRSIM